MTKALSCPGDGPPRSWTSELPTQEPPNEDAGLVSAVGRWIELAGVATGRATFYNTLEEQEAAEAVLHATILKADRSLYLALLTLEGLSDHTRLVGLRELLTSRAQVERESEVVERLLAPLPPQRALRLFAELRRRRVNHARARRLVLRYLLGSPKLELWSVRYRRKLRSALEHAWGKRTTSILRSVLLKPAAVWDPHEKKFVGSQVHRFCRTNAAAVCRECVRFVLGHEDHLTLPLLRAYAEAKQDLERGRDLPYETLEGLRGSFHRHRPSSEVLSLTSHRLTRGQRLALQRRAEDAGVAVEVDFAGYDAVRLYLYGFERGTSPELETALDHAAKKSAQRFALHFEHVGLLMDASQSMTGSDTQRLRPMATVLALRDIVEAASRELSVEVVGGVVEGRFLRPEGETDLAGGLLRLMIRRPEIVLVLSDGYENSPAGRFAEVVAAARALGHTTPILQLSPVVAAEAVGLRRLAEEEVPALPLGGPSSLGLTLLRARLSHDPQGLPHLRAHLSRGLAPLLAASAQDTGLEEGRGPW